MPIEEQQLEVVQQSLPYHEALEGLQAVSQLLASLCPPAGSTAAIILTASGVEVRMIPAKSVAPAVSHAWLQKIEDGLEAVREATVALAEGLKNMDQKVASHAVAMDAARTALTQNEHLMESIVELIGPAEFSLPNSGEFANIS